MGAPSADHGGTSSGHQSLEDFLFVLADRQRRAVLEYFHETANDTVQLRDLTEYLRDREYQRTGEFPDYEQIKIALLHRHIPKGAQCGIFAYNEQHEQVRYFADDRLDELLACVQAIEWE